MQFTLSTLSASLLIVAASVEAKTQSARSTQEVAEARSFNEARTFGHFGSSGKDCYGAPIKPWNHGCYPGWTVGSGCSGIPKWDGGDINFCSFPFSQFLPICHKGSGSGHGGHGGSGGSGGSGSGEIC